MDHLSQVRSDEVKPGRRDRPYCDRRCDGHRRRAGLKTSIAALFRSGSCGCEKSVGRAATGNGRDATNMAQEMQKKNALSRKPRKAHTAPVLVCIIADHLDWASATESS